MKEIKTVIIDDETKSIDIIEYLIENHCPEITILGKFSDPFKGLEYIQTNPIDLLLLDIQMPHLDGFQVLDRVDRITFNVVFITAFDQYALRAFRYYAVDYILKPIEGIALRRMTDHLLADTRYTYSKLDYQKIIQRMSSLEENIDHLAIPTADGAAFVRFEDINRLQADSNYTRLFKTNGEEIYASKTLKYFENLLPPNAFFRPHQSHIINIKTMNKFFRNDGGYILMMDGKRISLARSKRQEFINRFLK